MSREDKNVIKRISASFPSPVLQEPYLDLGASWICQGGCDQEQLPNTRLYRCHRDTVLKGANSNLCIECAKALGTYSLPSVEASISLAAFTWPSNVYEVRCYLCTKKRQTVQPAKAPQNRASGPSLHRTLSAGNGTGGAAMGNGRSRDENNSCLQVVEIHVSGEASPAADTSRWYWLCKGCIEHSNLARADDDPKKAAATSIAISEKLGLECATCKGPLVNSFPVRSPDLLVHCISQCRDPSGTTRPPKKIKRRAKIKSGMDFGKKASKAKPKVKREPQISSTASVYHFQCTMQLNDVKYLNGHHLGSRHGKTAYPDTILDSQPFSPGGHMTSALPRCESPSDSSDGAHNYPNTQNSLSDPSQSYTLESENGSFEAFTSQTSQDFDESPPFMPDQSESPCKNDQSEDNIDESSDFENMSYNESGHVVVKEKVVAAAAAAAMAPAINNDEVALGVLAELSTTPKTTYQPVQDTRYANISLERNDVDGSGAAVSSICNGISSSDNSTSSPLLLGTEQLPAVSSPMKDSISTSEGTETPPCSITNQPSSLITPGQRDPLAVTEAVTTPHSSIMLRHGIRCEGESDSCATVDETSDNWRSAATKSVTSPLKRPAEAVSYNPPKLVKVATNVNKDLHGSTAIEHAVVTRGLLGSASWIKAIKDVLKSQDEIANMRCCMPEDWCLSSQRARLSTDLQCILEYRTENSTSRASEYFEELCSQFKVKLEEYLLDSTKLHMAQLKAVYEENKRAMMENYRILGQIIKDG